MRAELRFSATISLATIALGVSIYANAKPAAINILPVGVQERGQIAVQNYSTEATINQTVNSILQKELVAGVERNKAKGGLAVILNAKTGEIVAAVSANQGLSPVLNRLTANVENSAALRLANFAMAIDNGWLNESSQINVGKGLRVGSHQVYEGSYEGRAYGPSMPSMTVAEAFTTPSSVASGQIAEITGPVDQEKFLKIMGQLTPIQTGGVTTPAPQFPQQWGNDNAIVIGLGHGIANSPLHALGAVATLVNGGSLVTPTFAKPINAEQHRHVIGSATSERLRYLLKANVDYGSAKAAQIPGLPLGALTGVNEKILGGHYLAGRVQTSFVAAFPINSPQYVVMLQLDEPKSDSDNAGNVNLRANTAFTGALIIKETAPLLGVRIDKS